MPGVGSPGLRSTVPCGTTLSRAYSATMASSGEGSVSSGGVFLRRSTRSTCRSVAGSPGMCESRGRWLEGEQRALDHPGEEEARLLHLEGLEPRAQAAQADLTHVMR